MIDQDEIATSIRPYMEMDDRDLASAQAAIAVMDYLRAVLPSEVIVEVLP